ncbi:MAG: transporter [Thermoanaerobaculia bacterium]|nr:transporter [Thermoanaerobaculia bacterium]
MALSWTSESYDEFWVGNEKVSVPDLGEVTTRSLSTWFTWGLTDNLALVANVAHVDVDTDGLAGFEDSGVQDASALVEYRFARVRSGALQHDFVVAGGLRTPLSNYVADAPISLGDGTTDVLFRFVYQLRTDGFYFSQQVGYDVRGEDAPDGFPLYTELGRTWNQLTLSGFYIRYLADGGTDIGDPGFTFPSNQDETQRVGAKLFYRVTPRIGVTVLGFTTLDGRNSGDTSGVSVGGSFAF